MANESSEVERNKIAVGSVVEVTSIVGGEGDDPDDVAIRSKTHTRLVTTRSGPLVAICATADLPRGVMTVGLAMMPEEATALALAITRHIETYIQEEANARHE